MKKYDDRHLIHCGDITKDGLFDFLEKQTIEVNCPCCGGMLKVPCDVIGEETEQRLDKELKYINNKLNSLLQIARDTGIEEYERRKFEKALDDAMKDIKKHYNLEIIK